MRADTLELGPTFRGIVLRIALVAVVVAAMLVLHPLPAWQIIGAAAALAFAVHPPTYGAWLALAVIPIGLLSAPADPLRTVVAVLSAHLVQALAVLIAVVPARARVAPRALAPALRRFVAVQAIAQAAASLVWLTPAAAARGYGWLSIVGALAVAAAAVLALWRLRGRPGVGGPA